MGTYLNPGNDKFIKAIQSKIYVDKTGLIAEVNAGINTSERYMCISRPRRFGKSMGIDMLAAYYDCEADSEKLFEPYEISKALSFDAHLGKYDVIQLNISDFLDKASDGEQLVSLISNSLMRELGEKYNFDKSLYIEEAMDTIYRNTSRPFVILIDEWDCVFRVKKYDEEYQHIYLNFLRRWLKDKGYVALAYMTGILPVKKYGTHSALNMFDEFSMIDQGPFAKYTGFTQSEVCSLCKKYDMDIAEMESWYNGYKLYNFNNDISIYNPKSVVTAIRRRRFAGYWNQTESYEALKIYIDTNKDGLRDAIIDLLAGNRIRVDVTSYRNDMVTFTDYEDILTLLIHLGYLSYDIDTEEVFIPNKEIEKEFVTAMKGEYDEVVQIVKASTDLLKATWMLDADYVARSIDLAHQDESDNLSYNSEKDLSNVISLAYLVARDYYTIIKEFPTGKGFADVVYIPKPNHLDKPAMIIELKWNQTVETAISQIKEKRYPDKLKAYKDNLLLVGITYDKKSKMHEAVIEKM